MLVNTNKKRNKKGTGETGCKTDNSNLAKETRRGKEERDSPWRNAAHGSLFS